MLRFEHGGFGGGGGGNSRWVEEARDDGDWSKPLPRNERLEQWVWLTCSKDEESAQLLLQECLNKYESLKNEFM